MSTNTRIDAKFLTRFISQVMGFMRLTKPALQRKEYVQGAGWDVDPDDSEPWLPLPEGWVWDERSHISRDGLDLYGEDFEVIVQPGQTFIKPMTAPGPTTRFNVYAAPGGSHV